MLVESVDVPAPAADIVELVIRVEVEDAKVSIVRPAVPVVVPVPPSVVAEKIEPEWVESVLIEAVVEDWYEELTFGVFRLAQSMHRHVC